MAAVISGNGLGLFNTQVGTSSGGATQGRDSQYVNVATGNLILQGLDESIVHRGHPLAFLRTYNSAGTTTQVGADGWATGFERHIELVGTLNDSTSTLRRYTGDGGYQEYFYVSANKYRSTAGDGGHDELVWNDTAKTWTWIERTTRMQEVYADHATLSGRLLSIRDTRHHDDTTSAWNVSYFAGTNLVESVLSATTTPSGLLFTYSSGRLVSVATQEAGGAPREQVRYEYDGAGRLASVLVDLTPADERGSDVWNDVDASLNDGSLFRTSYEYDGASLRILRVRRSDQTLTSFTYDANGRVRTVTQGDVNADDLDGAGQTITYSYDAASRRADVSDSAGRTWTYFYDASNRLTQMQEPAWDGLRDVTHYAYDSAGNLVGRETERGGVRLARTTFEYDSWGNPMHQWDLVDSTAGTYRYTYRTYYSNQIQSEKVFTDLTTAGQPLPSDSAGLTTRYVYDTRYRLRFVINAAGEVREMTYHETGHGVGQLATTREYVGEAYSGADYQRWTVEAWAAERKAASTLVQHEYDALDRLTRTVAFAQVDSAGAGVFDDSSVVTEYTRDLHGQLLARRSVYSSTSAANDARDSTRTTSYAYDGMGRLLSEVVTDRVGGNPETVVSSSSWAHVDSANSIRTVLEGGGRVGDGLASNDLLRIEVRDAAGQVVSTRESAVSGGTVRSTQHYYDTAGRLRASQDAGGGRTYFFYDARGDLAGQVDETGALTEFVRNGLHQVVETRAYSIRLDTSTWLSNGRVVPQSLDAVRPASDPELRRSYATYDGQGRVQTRTDAAGSIITYSYDGVGRLVSERQTDAAGTPATARLTRYFHDAAGRQIARLDAEGYLTEFGYDRAGRLVRTVAYATATAAASRASGTLDALRPATSAQDQVSRTFYDGLGNVIGQLDAEGYFSEGIFDAARNERASRRYALQLTSLTGSESFADLRRRAQAGSYLETRRSYDARGLLTTEVNAEGTVTRYTYDALGQLVKTESAQGTGEQRDGVRKLDVFGNVVAELSGEGAAKLTAGMTDAQVDAIFAQFGVRHSYDVLGRRIETIDAAGNKTWYFYDSASRLTHTVRGVHDGANVANAQGEVTETRYTAFGEVRETLAYAGRITIAVPGSRDSVASAVATLQYVAEKDNRTQLQYDRAGRLTERVDGLGYRTNWLYDAFGQMTDQVVQLGSTRSVTTRFDYDLRGQRRSQIDDVGGLARSQGWTYDAFGRAVTYTDGRGSTVTTGYDRLGRQISVSQTVYGRLETSSMTYDAWSRVLTQTDATGRAMSYIYTDAERKVVARSAEGVEVTTLHNRHGQAETTSNAAGTGKVTYDKNGQALTTVAADGGTARRVYDARGLLQYSFDETDRKTEYQYDAAGRMTARIEDPDGLKITTRYQYDGQGRQVAVTDPNGVVSSMRYDAKGQLVETVQDVNGLKLTTHYSWDARGLQLSVTQGVGSANPLTVQYGYDNLGRRTSETVAPGTLNLTTQYRYDGNDNVTRRIDASGRSTWYTYDQANRLHYTIDGSGGVSRNWYDKSGRLTATRQFADRIDPSVLGDTPTSSQLEGLVPNSNKAQDTQQYFIYDRDGRVALTIDGAGAVTRQIYDAAGRPVRSIRYANAITISSIEWNDWVAGTTTPEGVLYNVTGDPARDVDAYSVLDAVGRARFTVAVDGSVTELRYDSAGRVTASWTYATPLDASERSSVFNGTMGIAALESTLAKQDATARVQVQVYDGAGRERYALTRDVGGAYTVLEQQFDASGRVVAQIRYGTRIPAGTALTEAAVAAAVQASQSGGTEARTTRFVYDAAGRQRFVLDASGAVTETRYDAAGRVTHTVAYGQRPQAGERSLADLTAWAGQQAAAHVRSTFSQYDAAGRLESRRDAAGNTESFGYDGAGRVERYTDRNNAVWNYTYDAAGRRVTELSPAVTVATVDRLGNVVASAQPVRLLTRIAYDGMGNVTSRTENADTDQARTTQYVYDNRGNQIRTVFPDAWRIDEATGELVATGVTPTIEVTYDTLNRAVVQKDVRGYYSYKVYDRLGQLAYEVDQEGHATRNTYNAFGEKVTLTRFANALNTAAMAGWSAGQPITAAQIETAGALAASAGDRTITTRYDARGQAIEVQQSAVSYYNAAGTLVSGTPTTQFAYDVYGQLSRESVLLEGTVGSSTARWADTYRFYDVLGRNTLTVDPEGYATSLKYSATGEVTEQVEHARALAEADRSRGVAPGAGDAETGYDRITRWSYDAMGRKATETVVRRYQRADGSAGLRNIDTTFGYDGEGRATSVTTEAGVTRTAYDALGRVSSVQEPTRAVLTASAETSLAASTSNSLESAGLYEQVSPYTSIIYDAFGNAVQTRRYANGLKDGQATPTADDSRDQVEVTRYDRQGRAVMTRSAEGARVYSAYDAADHVIAQWYTLSGSDPSRDAGIRVELGYDKAGRQLSSKQTRTLLATGATTVERAERVSYNAFGEISTKSHDGIAGSLQYQYDAAGRMVSSNEGGVTRAFGYNLAGHQVRESHKAYLSAGNIVDAVTWNTTDRLGRAVASRMPSSGGTAVVEQQFDRWGNVVQILDARGFQTNYRYNDFNQIIRDERPLVEVVSETGARSWTRPVNEWFYDAFGRLVATKDANGNVRSNEYDATGRLLKSKDALGNATLHAYDALGNQRLTQNALGYITFKAYDRQGRVSSIGDYLPDSSGAARSKTTLQSYLLNQNGDRVRVTDALNHSALYDYDGRNQLLRSQTSMGVVMTYAYDVLGRKTLEAYPRVTDESTPDVWVEEQPGVGYWEPGYDDDGTRTDREGEVVNVDQNTWDYDLFGRLTDHNNLSGRDHDYTYDNGSGQLTGDTAAGGAGAGASRTLSYFADGRLRQVVENGGATTFTYGYDASGNRNYEESVMRDGTGALVRTITRTYYDSHNRIQRVTQDDLSSGTAKRVFDLRYDYDAVGNRRRVLAQTGYGPDVQAVPVSNTAPTVAGEVSDYTVRTDTTSKFSLFFSDVFRDAEQDALSLTVTQADGSGLPAWLTVTHDPATGRLTFNATPAGSLAGTSVTVRLTAHETSNPGNAVSTEFKVQVTSNTTPTILGTSLHQVNVKTGHPWSMEITAAEWFSDIDVGDTLRLSVDNLSPSPMPWADIDTSHPSAVRLSGNPAVGTYDVKVRATDQRGASVVRTFRFVVANNQAPYVVAPLAPREPILGRTFEWSSALADVFRDADDAALTITASGLPPWLSFQHLVEQASPEIKLTGQVPASETVGKTYTVTFRATDADGASVTTTLHLTVQANRAPQPVYPSGWSLPSIRVNDTLDRTVAISALFTDAEADAIAVALSGTTKPAWLNVTVDHAAGTIRFHGRPTDNAQAGNFTFQLRGMDPEGLSSTTDIRVSVGTDHPPVRDGAVALSDRTLSISRNFSFQLPAGLFKDADAGDTLSLIASVAVQHEEYVDTVGGSYIYWVSHEPLPSWLRFDAATRTFSGTVPADASASKFHIRMQATDGRHTTDGGDTIGADGTTGDVDFAISLVPFVNSAPVYSAGSLPNRTGIEGSPVDFALPAGAFTEPDGDTLVYSALVQDSTGAWVTPASIGLSINSETGRITGTLANLKLSTYKVRIYARDPQSAAAYGEFSLTANRKPVAPVSLARTVSVNQQFSYTVTGFSDPEGGTLVYSAHMSDGSAWPSWLSFTSAGVLSGTPSAPQTYSITVTAKDPIGLASSTVLTLTAANDPPVYHGGLQNQTPAPGSAFSYVVPSSAFSDPNGDALTFRADANGAALPGWLTFNASTRTFSGTPRTAGTWTVRVLASDPSSISAAGSFTITVPNVAPTNPVVLSNRLANQGQAVSWALPSGAFTDANLDVLDYTLLVERPGYMEEYELAPGEPDWRWVEPQWVAASDAGLSIGAITGTITGNLQLLYGESSYRAKVIARDPGGLTVEAVFNIEVNRAPTSYATTEVVNADQAFSRTVRGFSDPDGDALTFSATLVGGGALPSWLTFSSTGVLSGTAPDIATTQLQVTARDKNGVTTSAVVTIDARNAAPQYTAGTIPSTLSGNATVAFSYQIPSNAFTDANGDPLTYSAYQLEWVPEQTDGEGMTLPGHWQAVALPTWLTFNASTRTLSSSAPEQGSYAIEFVATDPAGRSAYANTTLDIGAAPNYAPTAPALSNQAAGRNQYWAYTVPAFGDANGDALTYSSGSLPSGITFNASTRTFSGTPTTLGTHTLTITASDGRGGVTSASFTLTVSNTAPVPPSIANQTTTAGVAWSYTIPAFTDPNGDALSYTVSGLPSWMSFSASTRALSGMPSAVGSWTITVTATDAYGASASTSFTVTTPNRAPQVVSALPSHSIAKGKAWSYQFAATSFTDANGDALTYSASALPAGLYFDAANRNFYGTPTTLGSTTVWVTASDGRGGTVSTSFSISVVNSAPVAGTALPNRSANNGAYVSWALPSGAFSDPNGDPLTYSAWAEVPAHIKWVWNPADNAYEPVEVPASWVAITDSGLSVTSSNGTLAGNLRPLYADSKYFYNYRVLVRASDSSGAYADGVFTTVVNVPPQAPSVPTQYPKQNLAYSYTLPAFSDANGDALTYSVSGLPAGLGFTPSTRVISGKPTGHGSFTVTYTANDGRGGVTSTSFTMSVQANTAPVAPSIPNQAATVNVGWTYTVPAFTDANYDALTYTASGMPSGISFNGGTRTFSGTPTTTGTYTLYVTANDGRGGVTTASFTLTVSNPPPANRAPTVNQALADQVAFSYDYFSYQFPSNAFVDPDGNALTYTATIDGGTSLPSWLTFDASNRHFYGTPGGTFDQSWNIRVTARDPSGASVSDVFNLYKIYNGGGGGGTQIQSVDGDGQSTGGDSRGSGKAYRFDMGRGQGADRANGKGKDSGDQDDGSVATASTVSTIEDDSSTGTSSTSTTTASIAYQTTEHWFTYDAENRLKVNNGILVDGQIRVSANKAESYELMYDAAGRAVARYRRMHSGMGVRDYAYRTTYDLRGQKLLEFHPEVIGTPSSGVSRALVHDASGRLVETRGYFRSNETRQYTDREGTQLTIRIGGWLSSYEKLDYDRDGRLVRHETDSRASGDWWEPIAARFYEEGEPAGDQTTDLSVLSDDTLVHGYAFDAAGRNTSYQYADRRASYTHTYTTTYQGWDAWQEAKVTGVSTNTNYRTTTNTLSYDGMGRLVSQREHTTYTTAIDDRLRYYTYNGDGRVQFRRSGTVNSSGVFEQKADSTGAKDNVLFVHGGGQQQAQLKEGGKITRYDGTVYETPQLVSLGGIGNYAAGGGKVVVMAGEKLSDIAQRVYGNGQLWYVLADANGLNSAEDSPVEGTQLNAPGVNVSSNDASTFKPYNPGEAIGSTAPGLPYIEPPPKKDCNVVAMVLMIVVAVVVTYFTAGAATKFFAGMFATMTTTAAGATAVGVAAAVAGGFVGGVAGSIASQAVGSALGVASFNWKQVAVDGLTNAVTMGAGQWLRGFGAMTNAAGQLNTAGRVAQGLISYGGSMVANVVVGRDTNFSWKAVAANMVGSVLSAGATSLVPQGGGPITGFLTDFATNFVGGAAQATARRMFGMGKQDWGQIAIDAFGNAVGNAVNARIDYAIAKHQFAKQLKSMTPEQALAMLQMNLMPPDAGSSEQGGFLDWLGDVFDPNSSDEVANPLGLTKEQRAAREKVMNLYEEAQARGSRKLGKDAVKDVQSILVEAGFDLGTSGVNDDGVDGAYGKRTRIASLLYVLDPNLAQHFVSGEQPTGQSLALIQGVLGVGESGSFDEATRNALGRYIRSRAAGNDQPVARAAAIHHDPSSVTAKGATQAGGDGQTPMLGFISAQYETGYRDPVKGVGKISNGSGDPGGRSYGSYQLSSTAGTLQAFLSSKEFAPFAQHFAGIDRSKDLRAFDKAWAELGKSEPDAFFKAQHDFIERTHYRPVVAHLLSKHNIDADKLPVGVQNALWSMSVQHSGKGVKKLIDRAVTQTSLKTRVGQPDFSSTFVNTLYDVRTSYVARLRDNYQVGSRNWKFMNSVVTQRYPSERQQALKYLNWGH